VSEPVPGRPCPVCGLPDPDHDWDVHESQPATPRPDSEALRGAALPDMLRRASARGGHRVRVLALHTTEGITRAADLRAWVGWAGSSHAAADAGGVLMTPAHGFVPYHLASWTLRSGNPWSENIELCGWARWIRADWVARPRLLEAAARWLADRSQARGIPLVKITAAQYRAGASGVIDHNDHTTGYRDGTHWDVGTSFPWDAVLPRAQQLAGDGGDDMFSDEDRQRLMDVQQALGAKGAGLTGRELPVADTILHRMRDLTAAVGAEGAAAMQKAGKLPPGDTTLGIVRNLRDQLIDLVELLEKPGSAT
jgi:hypothetical protein